METTTLIIVLVLVFFLSSLLVISTLFAGGYVWSEYLVEPELSLEQSKLAKKATADLELDFGGDE